MSLSGYVAKSQTPELVTLNVLMVGTGASAPTADAESCEGVTITRTNAGIYKLALARSPGRFVNVDLALMAATPGDIKNHSLIADTWIASTNSIELSFFDAAGNAHDLAANEYISATLKFKRTKVRG